MIDEPSKPTYKHWRTILWVARRESVDFEVEAIAASMADGIPGFSVTCWDSFERQRIEMVARIEQIMRETATFTKPELLLGSLENRRLRHGPGHDVQVAEGDVVHTVGHLWRQDITFWSDLAIDHALIQQIVQWLSENVGAVSVSDMVAIRLAEQK